MLNILKRLVKDEEGQGLVEYGLILGLISLLVIASLTSMGGSLKSIYEKLVTAMTGADTASNP